MVQRRRESGETAPRVPARPGPKLAPEYGRIRKAVKARPDATLAELRTALGLTVSLTTLWRASRRLKLTLEMKSVMAAERRRPDVTRSRAESRATVPLPDPERLVFIREPVRVGRPRRTPRCTACRGAVLEASR